MSTIPERLIRHERALLIVPALAAVACWAWIVVMARFSPAGLDVDRDDGCHDAALDRAGAALHDDLRTRILH